jgi:hypothetical protein
MQLLISDANILIDLEEGRLLTPFFSLPYEFKVPDVLFEEELREQHSELLELGLFLGELSPESVIYAFALALARQEECPLLTGDMTLRKTADKEAILVKGTLWVVEQMVVHEIITKEQALEAYDLMKKAGRRLPWPEAIGQINDI